VILGDSPLPQLRSPLKDRNTEVRTSRSDKSPVKPTSGLVATESEAPKAVPRSNTANRETFTRTTVTEREEKVHRKQVVRFTGLSEESAAALAAKYANSDTALEHHDDIHEEHGGQVVSHSEETIVTTKKSSSRSPSPKLSASPVKKSPSPKKVTSARSPSPSSRLRTPIVTSAHRTTTTTMRRHSAPRDEKSVWQPWPKSFNATTRMMWKWPTWTRQLLLPPA